jgi:SAM-dependent methyltransferase
MKRVLDFGCGDGGFDEILPDRLHLGSWLGNNGHDEAWGIDINPAKIEVAKTRITNGAKLRVMDGCDTYFDNDFFDVVHCWGVLHHIEKFEQAILEISRILKPGGILYLTESVDNNPAFFGARRLWCSWQGDKINGFFTTRRLRRNLLPYFEIVHEDYYYRALISDVLRNYHKEPAISLKVNHALSKAFTKMGIAERMCCHYSVLCIRRG